MTSVTASNSGGGRNARRGMDLPVEMVKVRDQRAQPGAPGAVHRLATWRGTTRSAATRRLPGARRRRIMAVVVANGGLATTWKVRLGSRRSLASAWTTVTGESTNRLRSCLARPGWSSTAMTRAPAERSGAVKAPDPAPMSRTRSPVRIPASATIRAAQRLSSRCHPHSGRGCPATEHHCCEGTHEERSYRNSG